MAHKFKILMVIAVFYPYTGGAEKQAEKLSGELMKKGLDITVITGRWSNLIRKREEFNGIKIIRNLTNLLLPKKSTLNTGISFFKPYDKKGLRTFLKKIFVRCCVYLYQLSLFIFLILHGKKYDVIHVHQVLYPAFISTLCARFLKKAVIAKVGSSGFNSDINQIKKFPEGKLQLKYILKNIDRIVCTSRIMKEEFVKEGADENKIVIIRNGVNVEDFERSYERCNTMVTMGRFIKSKNIVTLINAFSRFIEATDKELKLILIGNGPERDNILNLINKLGLGDKIVLTGMVSNPEEFLKESDLFIFPSLVEGISNSLIEAMSLKLPCIVSNIPGNIEVIGDNNSNKAVKEGEFIVSECGIFFNPSDISGLVKAIKYIFNNSEVRKKIGKNSYRRILTEYNIEEVSDRYLELYREVLKK